MKIDQAINRFSAFSRNEPKSSNHGHTRWRYFSLGRPLVFADKAVYLHNRSRPTTPTWYRGVGGGRWACCCRNGRRNNFFSRVVVVPLAENWSGMGKGLCLIFWVVIGNFIRFVSNMVRRFWIINFLYCLLAELKNQWCRSFFYFIRKKTFG